MSGTFRSRSPPKHFTTNRINEWCAHYVHCMRLKMAWNIKYFIYLWPSCSIYLNVFPFIEQTNKRPPAPTNNFHFFFFKCSSRNDYECLNLGCDWSWALFFSPVRVPLPEALHHQNHEWNTLKPKYYHDVMFPLVTAVFGF